METGGTYTMGPANKEDSIKGTNIGTSSLPPTLCVVDQSPLPLGFNHAETCGKITIQIDKFTVFYRENEKVGPGEKFRIIYLYILFIRMYNVFEKNLIKFLFSITIICKLCVNTIRRF